MRLTLVIDIPNVTVAELKQKVVEWDMRNCGAESAIVPERVDEFDVLAYLQAEEYESEEVPWVTNFSDTGMVDDA